MRDATIQDIVKNQFCTGCGVCTSESDDSSMIWDENGFLVPDTKSQFSTQAVKLCPFNPFPDPEVRSEDELGKLFFSDATHNNQRVGRYENTYVGYSNSYRKSSSSGGIATYVFEQLLSNNVVDHLFIVKEINGSYAYQWFDNVDDIKKISKTRYVPVTMEDLFKTIDTKEGKVGVSGVACFIKAIRLKQHYYPRYKEKISFLVGIICGGLKSRFFTDYLAQKAGISGSYNKQEYRIKDPHSRAIDYSFGAYDDSGDFHQMKMRTVGDMWGTGLFKSHACDFCDDVTTELADISLGDAWISPYNKEGLGTSVIVARTVIADVLITEGIQKGLLSVERLDVESFKSSQGASFKHRQMALQLRIQSVKKKQTIVPHKRERFFQRIPLEFQLVQKWRMIVRQESLDLWAHTRNADKFEMELSLSKKKLTTYTRVYHWVQRIKKKLRLKTM